VVDLRTGRLAEVIARQISFYRDFSGLFRERSAVFPLVGFIFFPLCASLIGWMNAATPMWCHWRIFEI
jgi:hypothetical protein